MRRVWTVGQAAKVVGVPARTVLRWIRDGLVGLRLYAPEGRGTRLLLLEDELLELWAIADLRKQGVSLQRVRGLLYGLAEQGLHLSDYRFVLVRGSEVTGLKDPEELWEQVGSGQFLLLDVEEASERLRETPGEPLAAAWELFLDTQEAMGLG